MERKRRPTSADVARKAGVSRATVSYVLNGKENQSIPDATRQRVWDAARSLHYTPSATARMLRKGTSDIVLGILPDWPIGYTLGALIDGLSSYLRKHGLTFVVHPHPRDAPLESLWPTVNPTAILLLGPLDTADMESLRAFEPGRVVEVAYSNGSPEAITVGIDRVGRLQAEHLVFSGHRTLGFAYPDDPRVTIFAEDRLGGVRAALADLALDMPLVATVGLEAELAAPAVKEWLAAGVTGICAYNDEVALAVLAGARRCGVKVPQDLAVVGVDDIPSARLSAPALTTVAIDVDQTVLAMGSRIVRDVTGSGDVVHLNSNAFQLKVRESA